MTQPENQPLKDSLTAASLALKLLGILERVLPAFLVAWNNHLSQKRRELELKVARLETEARIAKNNQELKAKNDGKTAEQVINDFLKRGP